MCGELYDTIHEPVSYVAIHCIIVFACSVLHEALAVVAAVSNDCCAVESNAATLPCGCS